MPDESFVLLHDQPCEDAPDPLGFSRLAEQLGSLIVASRNSTPLTIGVVGGWGSGKSSLMKKLDEQVSAAQDIETIWFNAWTAEGTSMLQGMIKSVLSAIGPKVLRRTLRRRRLMGVLRVSLSLSLGALGLSRLVDDLWETLSADAKSRNELRELLQEAMADWREKRFSESGRLLVIFIDDLDRCSPGNVLALFEAMKLYLDAAGFVFVIGYDGGIIAQSLNVEKEYAESRAVALYLEKIIQIECRIPIPTTQESATLLQQLVERSGVAALLGPDELALIAERTGRNPRRAKRFLNSFVLYWTTDPSAQNFNPREAILLRLLAISFPEFLDLMRRQVEGDPIQQYLDYVIVHDWARRGSEVDFEEIRRVFAGFSIGPPGDGEARLESLERLRRSQPQALTALTDDLEFRSLIAAFGDREGLADRLREASAAPLVPAGRIDSPTIEDMLAEARLMGERWQCRTGTGWYFRAMTLPECVSAARRERRHLMMQLEILDPLNVDVCEMYARWRGELPGADESLWTGDFVRRGCYASIVAVFWFRQRYGLLDISVGLSDTMTPVHLDLSSRHAFVSAPDGASVEPIGTDLYNRYALDMGVSFDQARKVPMEEFPAVQLSDEPTVGEVRRLLKAVGTPLPKDHTDRDAADIIRLALRSPRVEWPG